ncbi:MAG: segregation and condensation protein A [Candidatus Kapaibacteriota bacterium]
MFKIKLKDFEGPFDLLLYFIKRDELDIYNIPIAQIANEFLEYVKIMQILDIEIASEFIVMASTLLQIKAQMLLKQDENSDEQSMDENDPRKPLVEQLIEYKKYKEAAKALSEFAETNKYHYYRQLYDAELSNFNKSNDFKNANVFNLLNALQIVLKRRAINDVYTHQVQLFPISIEEKKEEILTLLKRKSRLHFLKYIEDYTKIEIIVSFLAILEMSRTNIIQLFQEEEFSDIVITMNINLN